MTISSPQFDPMERSETLTEQAYQRLKKSLISGAFVPGQKITTRTIAAALGVSPTPAREAIGRLVAERALDFGSNRSVFVPKLDKSQVAEIYEIRIALEGMAAEMATSSIGEAGIERLTECQLALVAARERQDFKTVLDRNEEFHFMIYRASGRPMLVQMIEGLWLRMGPVLNLLYPEFTLDRHTVKHHEEAIKALRAGDPKRLRNAIASDLKEGAGYLTKKVDQLGEQ
jgi:DNA-binding GntR family transcriptional regulator